eukprot:5714191-Prymnesium_polylepis.1
MARLRDEQVEQQDEREDDEEEVESHDQHLRQEAPLYAPVESEQGEVGRRERDQVGVQVAEAHVAVTREDHEEQRPDEREEGGDAVVRVLRGARRWGKQLVASAYG